MNENKKVCDQRAIGISPAMIQAGVRLLSEYDRGWDDPQELVEAIFMAMVQEAESR